jgi:membrane-associated phospholipid phosphatase
MPQITLTAVREEWQGAWESTSFRRKVLVGLFIVIVILSVFPAFFQTIEKRNGILLNDPVLRWLPPHNVSLAIFIIIWSVCLLLIYRVAQAPRIFIVYLWSFIFLSLFRILTITLVPLDPPAGLLGLVDPISNFFYGEKFVTRDLFFSGHTSTVFLMYLCLPSRLDRRLALFATVAVGFLLLVQHVHYTLDVLGAFVFAWIARWIALQTVVKDQFYQK